MTTQMYGDSQATIIIPSRFCDGSAIPQSRRERAIASTMKLLKNAQRTDGEGVFRHDDGRLIVESITRISTAVMEDQFLDPVLKEEGLQESLRRYWSRGNDGALEGETQNDKPGGDRYEDVPPWAELAYEIILSDRCFQIEKVLEGGRALIRGASAVVRARDERSRQRWEQAKPEVQRNALRLLTNYQESLLRFRWLPDPLSDPDLDNPSVFEELVVNKRTSHELLSSIQRSLKEADRPSDVVGEVRTIVETIAEIVHVRGYKGFVDDFQSAYREGGRNTALGNQKPINIIPSHDEGSDCHEILLAVSKGPSANSGSGGYHSITREVGEHLWRCSITKTVIVLTDRWESEQFDRRHANAFREHYGRGVRFVCLMASPNNTLSPASCDFS